VVGPHGRIIVQTATTETAVGAGGGPIAASLDLSGLPPGTYQLALVLGRGADTVSRSATFRMGGFETARALAHAESSVVVPDRFTNATEAQLDSLAEPLVYIAEPGDLTVYRGLTFEGKQRFLRDFWRHRNPSPGGQRNEVEDGFYQRITLANRRFREGGGAQIPGWRTDRGRVFIRYGDPDDVRRKPQSGSDLPWEAWKYRSKQELTFVFLDKTQLGNYSLIYSDDRLERNPGDWMQLLSPDAVQEITNF
jgi:GWxTD domain-containing protein